MKFGPKPEKLKAIISPWIRELAEIQPLMSSLYYCKNCKGAFFSYPYSKEQMSHIYKEYRGPNYMKVRNRWENWYTPEYNDAHVGQHFVKERKKVIYDFINSEMEIKTIKTIVDVGGDRGQFIPEIESLEKRYVLDYSHASLMTGVKRLETLSEINNIDLIIYAHVMEHVSEPMLELKNLLKFSKYVYVEVPHGVPITNRCRQSRSITILGLAISRFPNLWSKFSKPSAGRIQAANLLRQSEHLNFFTPETFNVLSNALGVNCVTRVCTIPTPDKTTIKVIQAIFSTN
jgi:hypothetical protein